MDRVELLAARLEATMHVTALLLANRLDGMRADEAAAACDMLTRTIAPANDAAPEIRAARRNEVLEAIDTIGERALAFAHLGA
jgi:hypothetical protein